MIALLLALAAHAAEIQPPQAAVVKITGMDCAGCQVELQRALEALEPVKAAQVSFKDEIAFGIPFEEAAGADIATSPPTPPGYLTRTGFWLISLNGHMVAAIVKPNRNKYRFFDPNNGILQWSDPTAFDRFMNSFTGREQIGGLVTTKWLRFG